MEYYSIGETALINNVSTATLRYYDQIGLLKPAKIERNGYRFYTMAQFEVLDFIKRLKRRGVALDTIHRLLHQPGENSISAQLFEEQARIDKQIHALTKMKRDLSRYRQYYMGGIGQPLLSIYQKQFAQRFLYTVRCHGPHPEAAALELRRQVHSGDMKELVIYPPYGYLLDPEAFCNATISPVYSTCYVEPSSQISSERLCALSAGMYLCINSDYDHLWEAAEKLAQELYPRQCPFVLLEEYVKDVLDKSKSIYVLSLFSLF